MLDPDVAVRSDIGATSGVIRGAESVAKAALIGARLTAAAQFVIVNGAPGVIAFNEKGEPRSIVAFAVRKGRIAEITVFADPGRLRQLATTHPEPRSRRPSREAAIKVEFHEV